MKYWLIRYIKEYKFLYLGVIVSHISCFNFHRIINLTDNDRSFMIDIVSVLFIISFLLPLIFGTFYVYKSFRADNKFSLLSNIIHSYVATILLFAATYYQSIVLGDFQDAIHKKVCYESQNRIKTENDSTLTIMRVADRRSFRGINLRLWTGYDYPSIKLMMNGVNSDSWRFYLDNDYDELSTAQIANIVHNTYPSTEVVGYRKASMTPIYFDCLYFSIVCIATVGFGDISPTVWYTKMFVSIEVLIGLSIFIFAIGIMLSKWNINQKRVVEE